MTTFILEMVYSVGVEKNASTVNKVITLLITTYLSSNVFKAIQMVFKRYQEYTQYLSVRDAFIK